MSQALNIHPSDHQLTALKVGKLAPPELDEVERHLAQCDTCCEAMKTLPDDSLVELLQGSEVVSPTEASAVQPKLPLASAASTIVAPARLMDANLQPPPELASHPRYHILELLGSGGMGTVYKAEHRLMNRQVALKVLNPRLMNRPVMVERFCREAKAAARFSHPNIVTAYDADQAGDAHFLIMELVEGTITYNPKTDPGYLKDEAFRWFPADATFFIATNTTIFPQIAQNQIYHMGETIPNRDRFWKFKEILGLMDRASMAYSGRREHPSQARIFYRFTGSINRNRLVDFFRREWPGVTIEETPSKGAPVTLIHDSPGGIFGGAIALVGTTDLILARDEGPAKKHLDIVRECLAIREGHGISLPIAHAKVLQEILPNAWTMAVGETPEGLRKKLPRMFALARSAVMSASGTNDIEFRCRGSFATDSDAKLFLAMLNVMKQVFTSASIVINDPDLSTSVAKAFQSLQIERNADRITLSIQVPSVAWTALLKAMEDTPFKKLNDMEDFLPAKKK